jgi:hypothetical protein
MKFLVQFKLKPGAKNKAVEAFEQRGPSRNPGVTFAGAWIGRAEDVAFVLVDAQDEALVQQVAASWAHFGEPQIHAVIDVQHY